MHECTHLYEHVHTCRCDSTESDMFTVRWIEFSILVRHSYIHVPFSALTLLPTNLVIEVEQSNPRVTVSVSLHIRTITFEPNDFRRRQLAYWFILTLFGLSLTLKVKVQGHQRKNVVKVVGATSCMGFLQCRWLSKQERHLGCKKTCANYAESFSFHGLDPTWHNCTKQWLLNKKCKQ